MKPSALVVDDSGSSGPVSSELVRTQPGLRIVGTVRSLGEAVRFVESAAPDFVCIAWEAASEMQPEALNFLTLRTRLVFVTAYGCHFMHLRGPGGKAVPEYASAQGIPHPLSDFPASVEAGGRGEAADGAVLMEDNKMAVARALAAVRPVNAPGRTEVVPLDEILWIEAAQNYSKVYRRDAGPDLLFHRSMAAWEKALPGSGFLRLSRSVIIRLASMEGLTSCGRSSVLVSFSDSPKQLRLGRAAAFRLKACLRRNP